MTWLRFRAMLSFAAMMRHKAACLDAGVLLIAGGIGVTPMRVMFTECLQRGYPTVFIYTAREERDLAFLEEFREVKYLT